jgi:hypothetical protein
MALRLASRSRDLEVALARGANTVMPDLTPEPMWRLYEIYPDEGGRQEPPRTLVDRLRRRLEAMGRTVGHGPGGRRR